VVRINGRYDFEDPTNIEDKKKFDLSAYDPGTIVGIMTKLAAVTFRSNAEKRYPQDIKERNATEKFVHEATGEKRTRLVYRTAHRLPANTQFCIVLRANRKAADGTISVLRKKVYQFSKKGGVVKTVMLENSDPVYRALSRAAKILPAAFKNVLMPPKRTRGRNQEAEEE
jgi:hypothetical protein